MGHAERTLTANYGANELAGRIIANRRALVGEYVLGGSSATTLINWADPARPLIAQGASTYNADHVLVRPHATVGFGFDTGIVPHENRTLIVVRRNATLGTTVKIVGQVQTSGFGMRQFGANNYMSNGETLENQGAFRARPASASDVYFEAVVRVPRSFGKAYFVLTGTVTETISANATNINRQNGTLWIGGTGLDDSVTNNTVPIYYVALFQRPLAIAELQTIYDKLAAYYLAEKGVTVV